MSAKANAREAMAHWWATHGYPHTTESGASTLSLGPNGSQAYKHVIRPKDVARFTEGDCHIFAKALHDLTGWPLCAFTWRGRPDCHAFVEAPDGRLVDVEGPMNAKSFCDKWSDFAPGRWGRFTWAGFAEGGWDLTPQISWWSLRRAQQLAPIVVAETRATMKP